MIRWKLSGPVSLELLFLKFLRIWRKDGPEIKFSYSIILQENLHLIKNDPAIFPKIEVDSAIRKVVIHPNVSLFYLVKEQENKIYLVTFFNNRMNPDILKRLLDRD